MRRPERPTARRPLEAGGEYGAPDDERHDHAREEPRTSGMVAGAVSIEWAAPSSMRAASSNCRAAQAGSEQKSKKRRHRQFGLREKERERGLRAREQVGESGRAEGMGKMESIMVLWNQS